MRFDLYPRNPQLDECPYPAVTRRSFARGNAERATKNFGSLAHRDEPDAGLSIVWRETFSVIFYLQLQLRRAKAQPYPGFLCIRMPAHVIQRFLQDAVDLHAGTGFDGIALSRLL